MKNLINYISEEEFATPSNTVGMGNPGVDSNGNISEPIKLLKKKKKAKVSESILDDEDIIIGKSEQHIKIAQWLAEHTTPTTSTVDNVDDIFRQYLEYVKLNNDGTFDLPESTKFGWKNYSFDIKEELPDYIKFGNIATRSTYFFIDASNSFICTGFPRTVLTSAKLLGNIYIITKNLKDITFPKDVLREVDVLYITGPKLQDVWMNRDATILGVEINSSTPRLRKTAQTAIHNVPLQCVHLIVPYYSLNYMLKESGRVGWSTNIQF